jgi:hypothetical protein
MKMLEDWEKSADSWLLGNDKQQLVAVANDERNFLDVDAPISVQKSMGSNQFSKLFD